MPTTPHDATTYSDPSWSSPAETAADQQAYLDAARASYVSSFDSTAEQYALLTDAPPPVTPTLARADEGDAPPPTINATIAQLMEWVGDDPERAQQILDAENAKAEPRSTLVSQLEDLITSPE